MTSRNQEVPTGAGAPRTPHVVLVRPTLLDIDSRGKKMALTLARAGYRVTIACLSPDDDHHAHALGPVEVRLVPVSRLLVDGTRAGAKRRRHSRPPILGLHSNTEYQATLMRARLRVDTAATTPTVSARVAKPLFQAYVPMLMARRVAQSKLDGAWKRYRKAWTRRRLASRILVDELSAYPEIGDWQLAFRPVLEELEPDVIHAHDPKVLGAAWKAAVTLRARGRDTRLVYDAREDFAGIPPKQQPGGARGLQAVLNHEKRYARLADAVLTVSEPIAGRLEERLGLDARPTVVLNVPVARPLSPTPARDVRTDAKVGPDVPLLVYSGGVHHSRGVGLLVEALPKLPGVHLAIITVPFPHPMTPGLLERAEELGVEDRLTVLAPVPQGELLDYLATATVGVHPLEGGFPNHDAALPNKLFEYLHAGLPQVVSDAKEMAAFVRRHGLGDVFRTGDVEDLVRAVSAVLEGRAGVLSPQQRAALVEEFSWQRQEALVREVYGRVLGDRAAPAPADPGPFPPLDLA
ncbi:MAG TPA: glycosyltransferase family 4 protein [Kineosporiaceae bacterium]|nr:glycosyltransferase family 4 protein [Kineosporiaceae bacterium]